MNNYMSIFNGILSTDGTFLDIYLDGLGEHKKFSNHNNDEAGLLQHISSLMSMAKTRALGLRLLDQFLENCSVDALEKKGNLWITLTLKSFNHQELERDAHLIFAVLNKLIKKSQNVPDMAKTFVNAHISKVYESVTNVPLTKTKYALKCIETCLRTYPGSSGSSRGVIERFLWKSIDHLDFEVVQNCGKCLHLLQQVKGGGVQGINHKTQWKNYQLQLLGGIHDVFNLMFSNCSEIYDEKIEKEKLPWESILPKFDDEPVKKAAQMYIRCRNLLAYLGIALKEPFPVEKPILVKKILNVIERGLSVNCLMLEMRPIADNIALSVLLPILHLDLYNLLNTALPVLRGHVLPYAELILRLTMDSLKWTSMNKSNGSEKNLMSLRKKVYETLTLWCQMFNSGSLCDTIAEHLFKELQGDITPVQQEFTLQVLSGARKHMSKKARKQLQSIQNEKPKTNKTVSDEGSEKQQQLCIAALGCLQAIISSVGNFLKPTTLKMIQTSIIRISATFYEVSEKTSHLYSNLNCRIEIYNVLYSILMATHHLCPPPTELVLAIIKTASARDKCLKVRAHCGSILKNIEKLVHPQKESLLFTIEERDIRNAFIKMGQESLLRNFDLNDSNSLAGENLDDDVVLLEANGAENAAVDHENAVLENNISAVQLNEEHKIDEQMLNGEAVSDSIIENNKETPLDNVVENGNIFIPATDNEQLTSKLQPPTRINDQPKSPVKIISVEIVKAVKVNGETEDSLENSASEEPLAKKQKLNDDETDKAADAPNSIINLDDDDDAILADIASQFVDELD